MELADRIAVLNQGRIEPLASPQEIYTYPRSRCVAEFIGAANLLPASVAEGDEASLTLETSLGRIISPRPGDRWEGEPISVGTRVYVMVRPQDCILASRRSLDGENAWNAKVERVSLAGVYRQYLLTLAGERVRAWTSTVVDVDVGHDVAPTIPRQNVHVLPAAHSLSARPTGGARLGQRHRCSGVHGSGSSCWSLERAPQRLDGPREEAGGCANYPSASVPSWYHDQLDYAPGRSPPPRPTATTLGVLATCWAFRLLPTQLPGCRPSSTGGAKSADRQTIDRGSR